MTFSRSADSSTGPACSVVIPFYNEEACVGWVLQELKGVTDALPMTCEILIIDDGSSDQTSPNALTVLADWPSARLIQHVTNSGQAAALYTGMREARGKLLILMDGDGQNDPADIPAMIDHLQQEKADFVVGIRAKRDDPALRIVMSRVANAIRSRILGDGVSDTGCGLKVFKREVTEAFIALRTLYSFMPALAVSGGFRVVQKAVNHRPRTGGVSKYGAVAFMWKPTLDLLGVWWFGYRRFRLAETKKP